MNNFIFMSMVIINLISPENYLDRNIKSLEEFRLIEIEGSISSHDKTYSSNYFNKNILLFNKKEFRSLHVGTDINDLVKSIFFSTKELIGVKSYEKLVGRYGLPSQMIKMGGLTGIGYFSNEEYTVTSYEGNGLNCGFEDNPLIIIWDKQNFILEVHMDYQKGTSFISFKTK